MLGPIVSSDITDVVNALESQLFWSQGRNKKVVQRFAGFTKIYIRMLTNLEDLSNSPTARKQYRNLLET